MGSDDTTPPNYGKFHLYCKSDWATLPDPGWLIKDIIVRDGITLLYGPPKNKKSFIALSMACAIAAGKPWCGFETRKSRVLYICAEGFFGILQREAAWQKMHGPVADHLQYFRRPINFFNPIDVTQAFEDLKAQGFKPDFIVIDTLARSMSGGNESDTKDMNIVLEQLEIFRMALGGAAILLIHHTTKDGLSYRGSSTIHGGMDGMIDVKADGLQITLTSAGFKDADEFEKFTVRCESRVIETQIGAKEVLAVKDRLGLVDILNQPFTDTGDEKRARKLVETLLYSFRYDGATSGKLQTQSELKGGSFYRALDIAKEKGWIVGGEGQGVAYRLNPDQSWKAAIEPAILSLTGALGGTEGTGSLPPLPEVLPPPLLPLHPLRGVEVVVVVGEALPPLPTTTTGEVGSGFPHPPQEGGDPLAEAAELLKKGKKQ
jgi:AAA domain